MMRMQMPLQMPMNSMMQGYHAANSQYKVVMNPMPGAVFSQPHMLKYRQHPPTAKSGWVWAAPLKHKGPSVAASKVQAPMKSSQGSPKVVSMTVGAPQARQDVKMTINGEVAPAAGVEKIPPADFQRLWQAKLVVCKL